MRFHGLDLNLLVALDVLLKEQNVTAAGERLNISQSGMSGALRRLREYFGDELIVSAGRSSTLTHRAVALIEPVRSALAQIETTIAFPEHFVPGASDRSVTIVANDYVVAVLLAPALSAMSRLAPRMTFILRPGSDRTLEFLDRGEVDIVVVGDLAATPDHPSRQVMPDDYVAVASADNPDIGETLTMDDYFSCGHVTVQLGASRYMVYENWLLRNYGGERRIELVSPSFSAQVLLVRGTRRLVTMHRRHAALLAASPGLRILELPFPSPVVRQAIQWNRRSENDPAVVWVVDRLTEFADVPSASPSSPTPPSTPPRPTKHVLRGKSGRLGTAEP